MKFGRSNSIAQLNTSAARMGKLTRSSAATTVESAGAAEEFGAQAEQLRGTVHSHNQLVGANGAQLLPHQTITIFSLTPHRPQPYNPPSSLSHDVLRMALNQARSLTTE